MHDWLGMQPPFVLSLSKDILVSFDGREGMGFDRLSQNGEGETK